MSTSPRQMAGSAAELGEAAVTLAMSRRFLWTSVIVGSLVAMALCYEIATRDIVVGSRDGRWVYGYIAPLSAPALGAALVAIAVCCALLAASDVALFRAQWTQVLLWMLVALAVQALLRALTPFSLQQIFVSDGANSFYGVTRHYFASTVLRDFGRLRATFPLHAQSNMPGKLMLVYALKTLSRRPDVLPWLVVVVSNLGGVLMYLFVRDLFDDKRAALFASILYFFVPGKMFFFPLLNTVTPVVVLACACLVSGWLRTTRAAYALALGIAAYALVFFEPSGLVMGLLLAILVGRAAWGGRVPIRSLLWHGGLVALGFAASYAILYSSAGFDLADAFRRVSVAAVEFNSDAGRPYSIWVRANLREFLVGIGACQAVLVCAALVDGLRAQDVSSRSSRRTASIVCLGLLAVLAVTDLSGINRGEVTRLWIFLACFFQIPAAYVCARLESRTALALVLSVTLLEGALGTATIGFVSP